MAIEKISIENFTVFEKTELEFTQGINILIGENGTGKTHLMKVLYSACQATKQNVDFGQKLVRVMLPDDYKIARLVRRKPGNNTAKIKIVGVSNQKRKSLETQFSIKTKKWDAEIHGKDGWESELSDLSGIFIPAKEILSNSYNLNAAVQMNNVKFDDTYLDIINSSKIDISAGRNTFDKENKLKMMECITEGKTVYEAKADEFYLKVGNSKQEFNLVAEGIRKVALIWQLIKNGALEKGAVLFWDEPEANLNPVHIPIIVELLLMLQRNGVQVFVATHDYIMAKYFEVKREKEDKIMFFSFDPREKEKKGICYEKKEIFGDLKYNAIASSFNTLLDEIYDMGD